MTDDLKDLITYYTKEPSKLLINKVFALLGDLPDEEQKKVIEWLMEHQPKKSGLDIIVIREAMAECGIFHDLDDEEPQQWTCDLCGFEYRKVVVSCDKLRKQGIHDYCPRCGLAPSDTLSAMWHYNKHGDFPDWYTHLKKWLAENYLQPGQKPRYNLKEDEEYEKKQEAKKLERMKNAARKELFVLANSKSMLQAGGF